MKITICGSIAFIDEMIKTKDKLELMGHLVKTPPLEVPDQNGKMISVKEYYAIRKSASDNETWVWEEKQRRIREHLEKVNDSDAILVLNYDKNNIANYIGGNTLLEIGVAFHLKKKIFFLNQVPDISYKEELLGMMPIVISGDLSKIT